MDIPEYEEEYIEERVPRRACERNSNLHVKMLLISAI